jgi:hypothetical protein
VEGGGEGGGREGEGEEEEEKEEGFYPRFSMKLKKQFSIHSIRPALPWCKFKRYCKTKLMSNISHKQ